MNESDLSLKDRVVVVTGGTRGLGKEMALALLAAGARVAITGSDITPAMDETLAEGRALAGEDRIVAVVADVTDPGDCRRAIDQIIDAFGAVHVLVNNAGRGMRLISETFNTQPTRFWEADPVAWRQIIDTNVNGPFNMAHAMTPHLVAQGFGKIINVSTSDVTMVRKGYAPYGPSKAALEAASRVWAQDLAGTGVTVNVYLPGGAADTDLLPTGPDKKGADGKLLSPSIMRRGILWLCSDASNGHNGERYTARLWDESLPADDAAAGARSVAVEKPAIM
ncbi:SDR family NAD(P)-dependent oxidoreductase [Pigmentiphaga litoralis]|uniref:SDR family NAD(P)-dependent oxidoreductase n=1 Tax=Pigmentiphaga litoralis TaxID=516702 RepID=UPI003B430446